MNRLVNISLLILFAFLLILIFPSQGWLDESELCVSSFLLGIGHPPAQPLYVMFGKMAQLIPIGSLPLRLGVLSAVLLLASFFLSIKIVLRILKNNNSRLLTVISCFVGLYVFLSVTVTLQGVRAELYSLNLFIVLLTLYFLLNEKTRLAGFFMAGLGSGCHVLLLAAFLVPCFVYLLLAKTNLKLFLKGLLFFILGLSIYLYLPVRASTFPYFSFGNPQDFNGFMWVVTGELYKAYSAFDLLKFFQNFRDLFFLFFQQLNPIFVFTGIIGIILSFKLFKKEIIFLGLTLALNSYLILSNMHFDTANPDAQGYLLISFFVLYFGGVYLLYLCIKTLLKKLKGKAIPITSAALMSLALAFASYQAIRTYKSKMLRNDYSASIYIENALSGLPFGSSLISGSFSTFSLSAYKIFAENYRNDVDLLYSGLFTNKGYWKNISHNFRDITEGGAVNEGLSLRLLSKFYKRSNNLFLELSIKKTDGEFGLRFSQDILKSLIPFNLFFKFSPQELYETNLKHREFMVNLADMYENGNFELKKNILLSLFLQAKFFVKRSDFVNAAYIANLGSTLNPNFDAFREIRAEIRSLK